MEYENKSASVSSFTQFMYLLIISTLLTACATPLKVDASKTLGDQHKFVRNYVLNQPMTVNVGEPIIKFQDYWIEATESAVVTPDKTVNLKGGLVDITLIAGQKYPVKGRMQVDGLDHVVVATTDNSVNYKAVLIKPDGTLLNRIATLTKNGLVLVIYTLNVSDPDTKLIRETKQDIKASKGYENFEILYTGTNANGLNLTYREFSPDGLARVAFFQNLTYEAGAKNISFKKYKIAVQNASSESITFTVLSDGI